MSFVMPSEVAHRGTPAATIPSVEIETRRGGQFAVYRFSGSWRGDRLEGARIRLRKWVEAQGLSPTSEPSSLAGYDPPFTPTFLRRNEVLIRLTDPETGPV